MKVGGSQKGFTVVELLIVIVVIAILAATAIVAYSGVQRRAYESRASSELATIARAIGTYYALNESYPDDVDRNIPVAIFDYVGDQSIPLHWPKAPWPHSVYDYDYFVANGAEVVQISIRFCPIHGTVQDCHFPNEPWSAGFDVQSSAYWCIKGACRSHKDEPIDHPGYCLNCND